VKNTKNFVLYGVLTLSLLLICYAFIIDTYEERIVSSGNIYENQNDYKNYSDSGIQGIINFIGSDCPPFSKKQTPPCSGPYPDLPISIYTDDNEKKMVATTHTDSNGSYNIILKPGKYIIYSSSESVLPKTIDITKANVYEHITIPKNETITKNYDIDTKIR